MSKSARMIERETRLDADTLRSLIHYDAETGLFKRLRNPALPVGALTPRGYVQIQVNGTIYFAHRLAWLYSNGRWPEHFIDHVNCDRSDNRLSNLRPATNLQNSANSRPKHRTRKLNGITPNRGRWQAQIKYGRRNLYLGLYHTADEANAAYAAKAEELFGQYARSKA